MKPRYKLRFVIRSTSEPWYVMQDVTSGPYRAVAIPRSEFFAPGVYTFPTT